MKKMKNIFLYIVCASTLFLSSSCEDNFDPKIYGVLSSTNFPETVSDWEAYFMVGYYPFGGQSSGYEFAPGAAGQHCFYTAAVGVPKLFDLTSDYCNPIRVTNWGQAWGEWSSGNFANAVNYGKNSSSNQPSHFEKVRDVTRMTQIIGRLQNAPTLPADKKTAFIAEARLLRGLMM